MGKGKRPWLWCESEFGLLTIEMEGVLTTKESQSETRDEGVFLSCVSPSSTFILCQLYSLRCQD